LGIFKIFARDLIAVAVRFSFAAITAVDALSSASLRSNWSSSTFHGLLGYLAILGARSSHFRLPHFPSVLDRAQRSCFGEMQGQ